MVKTTPKADVIRFTGKGQVVIPRWLRKELDIEEGTRALDYQEGDAIVLKQITHRHIRNLRGSLKCSGLLKALMDERKRERKLE
jgi:bifunctional DNA-binding transcriptional regulator/antitoxin component of YhaV-PrlF toxin-antitoxin module